MLISGFILGSITLGAFCLTYQKLPKGVKMFLVKHPLFTDVVMVVFFYTVMGFTVVAHVACATMALGAMFLLEIARNPSDYEFITDSLDRAKQSWKNALQKLKDINNEYKKEKELVNAQ